MTEYKVLTQEEQDDIIISFMQAQERDRYCHELNIARYTAMLNDLEPGEWRDRISNLLQESKNRLAEVESIIVASKPQLPSPERIEAARQRLKSPVEDKIG